MDPSSWRRGLRGIVGDRGSVIGDRLSGWYHFLSYQLVGGREARGEGVLTECQLKDQDFAVAVENVQAIPAELDSEIS